MRLIFEWYNLRQEPHGFKNLASKPETAAAERQFKAALQEWVILEQDLLPLLVPPGGE